MEGREVDEPKYPVLANPTGPVRPLGITTCSALGRAEETGTLSAMTDSVAPFTACQALRAADVPM